MRLTRDSDAGITMIELVVAVFVLAAGTVAALRVVDQSRLVIGGAASRLLAQTVALNRAEEIKLLGAEDARDLPDTVVQGPTRWTIDQTEAETASGLIEFTVAVAAEGEPGATLTVWVSPERLP